MSEVAIIPQEKIKSVPALIEANLPTIIQGSTLADEAMQKIVSVETDEEIEAANNLLVRVRATFTKIEGLRKGITKPLDDITDALMVYEKKISTDPKVQNNYNRIRLMIGAAQQRKLDAQRSAEAEAARVKQAEIWKSEYKQLVQNRFSKLMGELSAGIHKYATEHFNTATLELWDAAVSNFVKINPKLKENVYNECFIIPSNLDKPEVVYYREVLKQELTYESQNAEYQKIALPIMADWKAKIPDLKIEKTKIEQAGAEEKVRLEQEKKEREERENKQRQDDLDRMEREKNESAEQEKKMNVMQASFVEQAVTQQIEDAGPVNKVMKFTDPKLVPKALSEIIYHCFLKGYPIQKRNAKKELMFDEKGRPIYVDEVQKWINFFQKKCDAKIEGTEVFDDSKVIIRK